MNNWVVHKFGGSSLKDAKAFEHVGSIIEQVRSKDSENIALVLSAIGGTTDLLLQALEEASVQNEEYLNTITTIKKIHDEISSQILNESEGYKQFTELLSNDINDILNVLKTIWLSKGYNELLSDIIVGYGEIWSTKLMYNYLNSKKLLNLEWIDSREIIIAERSPIGPIIDWDKSKVNMQSILTSIKGEDIIAIFPGFIASSPDGHMTTLQRNGSDLTASILGVLLQSKHVDIWTDVNGIYSADPNRVPNAVILESITYIEALELAYFGAEVIHPGTIAPAMSHNIPIRIRNTSFPENLGTIISFQSVGNKKSKSLVKGFATIDSISLLNLEGSGMIGVPGISEKLFAALKNANISVIMISQASSEYSICVAIHANDGIKAKKAVEKAFSFEIKESEIQRVSLDTDCGILAVVGEKMVNQPGIASILFNALSRSRINVRMISQGSSERNISVILHQEDLTRGLRAVHSAFYLSHLTVSIGIIGLGLIGKSLLKQISAQQEELKNSSNIDLQVTALMNSKKLLLGNPINLKKWENDFEKSMISKDTNLFTNQVETELIPHSVIIDCSASDEIAQLYESWLTKGIHVITPNKKANSSNWEYYKKLRTFITKGPSTNPLDKSTQYFYETTVGAGLPIISTLRDLLKTGDTIHQITGIFSGTISYIFNQLNTETSFSDIVKKAHELGYTEPDPRDDLSGIDFARKLVILAREIGFETNLEDVDIEQLLPNELFEENSVAQFFDKLAMYDDNMSNKVKKANNQGKVLRYIGEISRDGLCSIKLQQFEESHVFANLQGSENVILFKTDRYDTYPLVVQGPGAGAEVTSGGIFAELLRLADMLGSS